MLPTVFLKKRYTVFYPVTFATLQPSPKASLAPNVFGFSTHSLRSWAPAFESLVVLNTNILEMPLWPYSSLRKANQQTM